MGVLRIHQNLVHILTAADFIQLLIVHNMILGDSPRKQGHDNSDIVLDIVRSIQVSDLHLFIGRKKSEGRSCQTNQLHSSLTHCQLIRTVQQSMIQGFTSIG